MRQRERERVNTWDMLFEDCEVEGERERKREKRAVIRIFRFMFPHGNADAHASVTYESVTF